MTVAADEVASLLSAMVRIESVTPWLIPAGSGEGKMAAFIADWLSGTGAEVEIVEVQPGRPNVLARLHGDRLYGLGAADDKSGCAAGMLVLRSLAASGPRLRGDLLLACVADEEG